jgi:hypothetical protein
VTGRVGRSTPPASTATVVPSARNAPAVRRSVDAVGRPETTTPLAAASAARLRHDVRAVRRRGPGADERERGGTRQRADVAPSPQADGCMHPRSSSARGQTSSPGTRSRAPARRAAAKARSTSPPRGSQRAAPR